MLTVFDQLLWAITGLLLTISGVFIEVAVPMPSFSWPFSLADVTVDTLGVSLQVGAVLFVSCMGGRNAALLSQVTYLLLGLSGLQIFSYGGGVDYVTQPTFGYLIGFVAAAWVCGELAFKLPAHKFVSLLLSSLAGLGSIHVCGVVYFTMLAIVTNLPGGWWNTLLGYSLFPLPGQLVILSVVSFLSLILRRVLMY